MSALRRSAFVITAFAAAIGLAACGSSGGTGSSSGGAGGASSSGGAAASSSTASDLSGSLTVFAAASLTEAFTTLGKQFESAHPGVKITFNFDASSALATSITQGRSADVFASASTKNMDSVVQAGAADSPTNFVSNTMEIATPPGNPAKIKKVSDLANKNVKVALCDVAVPCGATALKVFQNAKVTVHPKTYQQDVKSTLAIVETKEVQAGMVYVTDVRAAGSKVTGVMIPDSINAHTTYPIAVLKKAPNADAAKAWVSYVLSSAGQKVLQADGFSAP